MQFEQRFFEEVAGCASVRALCHDVARMIGAWVRSSARLRAAAKNTDSNAERDAMLVDLMTCPAPFAGRVARDAAKVEAALQGGQIRECLLLFNNFLSRRLLVDVICARESIFEEILEDFRRPHCEPWLRRLRERWRKENTDPDEDLKAKEAPTLSDALTRTHTPFGRLRQQLKNSHQALDYKQPGIPAEELEDEYLTALCRDRNISCPPHERLARLTAAGIDAAKLSGEQHPYAWSRVPSEALYIELSEREREFKNPVDHGWVPYIRGDYANVLNEAHPWVYEARARHLPLRAGPSGTAHRLVVALTGLGFPARSARLAAAGFLGPIHAHSCHEILFATDGLGECTYDPTRYTVPEASGDDALAARLFEHDGN